MLFVCELDWTPRGAADLALEGPGCRRRVSEGAAGRWSGERCSLHWTWRPTAAGERRKPWEKGRVEAHSILLPATINTDTGNSRVRLVLVWVPMGMVMVELMVIFVVHLRRSPTFAGNSGLEDDTTDSARAVATGRTTAASVLLAATGGKWRK